MHADRLVAVSAGAVLLLGLAGCSAPAAEPQQLTVTYTIDGAEKTADVDVPGLTCRTMAGRVYYETTDERDADDKRPFFANAEDGSFDSVVVTVKLPDDLWFTSGKPFTATEDGVSFDGVVGGVGPLDDSGIPSIALDSAATLTGALDCTEKK